MATEGRSFEVEVKGARPDLVWKYVDFAILDKVLPDLESYTVAGVPGEPGCTRYAILKPIPGTDGQPFQLSVTERLVSIDHQDLSYAYEALDNNVGLVGYAGHAKVVANGDGDSKLLWSFQAESYGQLTADFVLVLVKSLVQSIAKTIERAVEEGTT